MANATKYGFWPREYWNGATPIAHLYPCAASQTIVAGDPVALDSAGRVIIAVAASTTQLLGVAQTPVTSSSAGDAIWIYDDPDTIFSAMVSTGALTDVYTTRSAAAAFDLTGTTGAFYVNAAASSQDLFKCVGVDKDPVTGIDSAAGSNQLKLWKITPLYHVYGIIA